MDGCSGMLFVELSTDNDKRHMLVFTHYAFTDRISVTIVYFYCSETCWQMNQEIIKKTITYKKYKLVSYIKQDLIK